MDTVPVEVHEALKSAMEKLQVSKGAHFQPCYPAQLHFDPVSDSPPAHTDKL